MKRLLLLFVPALVVVGVLLVAGTLPTLGSDDGPPDGVAVAYQATATPASSEGATDSDNPAQDLMLAATPTRPPDQNCIDCHTDIELLEELAEEPEVVEVPSEGSG